MNSGRVPKPARVVFSPRRREKHLTQSRKGAKQKRGRITAIYVPGTSKVPETF